MFNSLTHKDKIVVLHETFNNASAIQSNGGIATDIVFDNGVCTVENIARNYNSTKSKYNL